MFWRLMVCVDSLPFALTMLTIHLLIACHQLAPARADDNYHAMCYHVYVILHVKDPQLSFARVQHCVPLPGFCLALYSLHVLNRDVSIVKADQTMVINIAKRNKSQIQWIPVLWPTCTNPYRLEAGVIRQPDWWRDTAYMCIAGTVLKSLGNNMAPPIWLHPFKTFSCQH